MSKFIFISGGVISGIGKGVTAASIGFLLKSYGLRVTMMKADPYINIDAGTMDPLEHGETFVLEDGFETDMDIGTYERFTGEMFTRLNSMTGGAVFNNVIKKERELGYDGKWVSVDYHVPREAIRWITEVSELKPTDVTIVEIGGTVGELGNKLFLEANRVMKTKNPSNVLHVHVSYLPLPANIGEMKSKPVQMSVKMLNESGINPDFIVARSEQKIDDIRKEKLSHYCVVPFEHIISAPDVESIYEVPVNFENEEFGGKIMKQLGLKGKKGDLFKKWEKRYQESLLPKKKLKVAIVCKHFKSGDFDLKDSYVSVLEALKHAGWANQADIAIEWVVSDDVVKSRKIQKKLKEMDGIIVPQGWGSKGIEGKIKTAQIARENKIPYLGLCFGLQIAVIEFARNVLGWEDANSEEVNAKCKKKVIHLIDYQKENIAKLNCGGKIRLGAWPCKLKKGSVFHGLYKQYGNSMIKKYDVVDERHRHKYEFNNICREELEKAGLIVSGESPDGKLVEAVELSKKNHPFFIGTQFHPELKSQFLTPHPIFMGFVKSCLGN